MTSLQPVRRRVAAVSAPILLALSLTACGGDSEAGGAPEDASTEEFCTAIQDFGAGFESDDTGEAVDAANDYGSNLAEIGTPEDLSEEGRAGFEAYIGFLEEVDEDDVEKLQNSDSAEDIFGDDGADVEAFLTEVETLCAPDLGELEGEPEGEELPE